MKKRYALTFALFSFAFVLNGFCEPVNLSHYKDELKLYHDNGAYEKELATTYEDAQKYVEERIQENTKRAHPKKLAIVFDIDETVLSNYPDMVKNNFGGSLNIIMDDIKKCEDPALKPALSFYQFAQSHGVTPFFVTGRPEDTRDCTIDNLKKMGFNHWKTLYLRPTDFHPKKSISEFKIAMRKQIEKEGYNIIASIGDQESDLRGPYADRGFKLPNPYYYLP